MEVSATTGDEVRQSSRDSAANTNLDGNAKLADDFDTFLDLLVTQLQNQDPMEPLKAQEFTNQLVQFSGVEQSLATNDKLDKLIDLQTGNRASTAVAYIGRQVEAESDQVRLDDTGARFAYDLEDNAESAIAQIEDEAGNVVRTIDVDTTAGRHEVVWDGTDDNGNAVADGIYTVNVLALDGDNQSVNATTTTFGAVTGVEVKDDGLVLNIGEIEVGLDSIKAIHDSDGQSA